ncbi:MAG: dihydropteroate synthase [Planktomarina sp.]|nr:dihydropteroate synthase [Planktomarina sp.]
MKNYIRPLVEELGDYVLAGGWCRFTKVEVLQRGKAPSICLASDIPEASLHQLTVERGDVGLPQRHRPQVMGILNTTPDSFSDGGQFDTLSAAKTHAKMMINHGADIIDIGGESTRPGAKLVETDEEIRRTYPVVQALRDVSSLPVSIDTRKAEVADLALKAGANWINDVSGLSFDSDMVNVVVKEDAPLCIMHSPPDPKTMQQNVNYDDVLLDVYDYLEARIEFAVSQGVKRTNIVIDPGIGFGKTQKHNLVLLRGLALFHSLGCPILLGASRKRFIGTISGSEDVNTRMPGSLAVALAAVAQGSQFVRVHDVLETVQALKLWGAVRF